jgi:hypothetical protein
MLRLACSRSGPLCTDLKEHVKPGHVLRTNSFALYYRTRSNEEKHSLLEQEAVLILESRCQENPDSNAG